MKLKKIYTSTFLDFYSSNLNSKLNIPYFESTVSAGFPSPADDHLHTKLDLNDLLVQNPSATYYVRVVGDSMLNAGIMSGDLLVVDRSLEVRNNCITLYNQDFSLNAKKICNCFILE